MQGAQFLMLLMQIEVHSRDYIKIRCSKYEQNYFAAWDN